MNSKKAGKLTSTQIFGPSTFYSRPSTFYPRPSTLDKNLHSKFTDIFGPSTFYPRPSTFYPRPSTLDPRQKPTLDCGWPRVDNIVWSQCMLGSMQIPSLARGYVLLDHPLLSLYTVCGSSDTNAPISGVTPLPLRLTRIIASAL